MFDMLDVAIGIAFVFLLTSLIASAVQEMIEARLKRRASDLRDGIGELLRDPPVMQAIYDHSLVNGLYKGANYTAANNAGDLPSYIPARNFALALMDIAFSTVGASGAQGATPMPPVVAGAVVVPAPPPVVPVNLAGLPAAPRAWLSRMPISPARCACSPRRRRSIRRRPERTLRTGTTPRWTACPAG